jgi:xylulokinase
MRYIVAYDLGTGGLKAALYSEQGKYLDSLFVEYSTLSARETWAEQSPASWWSGVCAVSRGLIEKHGLDSCDIAVVSFSGQMAGSVSRAAAEQCGLASRQIVAEKQLSELTGTSLYAYMTQEAEKSPPGAKNLVFLPYLRGERSPRWNPKARGAFIGLTASHTRCDIIRAVPEGITYNLKIVRDAIASQGARVEQMRAIGGAESRLWRQIFADVFQESIQVPELLEGANTLGSAIVGGVGVGVFESFSVIDELNPISLVQEPSADPQSRRAYQELFALFNACYEALTPVFDRM